MGTILNPPVNPDLPINPAIPLNTAVAPASPIRFLLIVATLGAVGGLAAAVFTRAGGVGAFSKWAWYADFLAEMLLGAVAAVIADIALVDDTKVTLKTFGRALMWGFIWSPTLSGVQANAAQHHSRQIAQSALSAGSELSSLAYNPSAATANQVEGAANALAQPLSKLNDVNQPDDKKAVITNAADAIKKFSSAPNVDPAVKVDALQKIGTASATTSPELSLRTIAAIKTIEQADPAVQEKATAAIQAIQSRNSAMNVVLTPALEVKH